MSEDFPINPEDRPINSAEEISAARKAWKADADRFVAEELPILGNSIQRMRDGTETLNRIIGLIEEVLPIVLGMGVPGSGAASALTEVKSSCVDVRGMLSNLQKDFPGVVTRIQALLNKA